MTGVSVLVPARLSAERARLWEWLRPRWEALGYEIVEGACPDGPWRKGLAVWDALTRATGEILVVADADVWCDGVPEAVQRVQAGAPWAIPHYLVRRLTRVATAEVLESGQWPTRRTLTTYAQSPYPGRPGGGLVVLRRDAYERVPIDPRFAAWGQEDESWSLALSTTLGRAWRGTADLWHLWHAPAKRMSRAIGSVESLRMYRRYQAAWKRPAAMAKLLSEARALLPAPEPVKPAEPEPAPVKRARRRKAAAE